VPDPRKKTDEEAKPPRQQPRVRRVANVAPQSAGTTTKLLRQIGDLLYGAGDVLHDHADALEEGEPS
jgi:hypothetical protein